MYHTINEFLDDWNFESGATLKILKNLTDESLNIKFHDKVRSLGRLAWHITLMVNEMMVKAGLSHKALDENSPIPFSAEEINKTYKEISLALADAIVNQWSDDSLTEEIFMYGETWTKEKILSSLIKHQVHHRGQLTILMRQAGLPVPGTYGPSFEEWQAIGIPPRE